MATPLIRVLIVDDHELVAESLVRLLQDDPTLRVVGTERSASTGIQRALTESPDLVIMDYSLPDMDGASATRLLRARLPELPVIMLTGSDRPGSYSNAMEAGCAAWVRKTHATHELLDAIHRVAAGETITAQEYEELPSLDELVVYYQPIVELTGLSVVGFEALVRWRHPQQGVLLPARFLHLAEETGYITDIDRHVAFQALQDLAEWQRAGNRKTPLWVSINTSARTLASPSVVRHLAELAVDAGMDPADLVIEITETVLLEDTPAISDNLTLLKKAGLRLSLDDFGTAFSSLSYLRRIPFDYVKIDTSFTAELPHNPRALLLIESIQHMTSDMGAAGIAEGIERADQARCLTELGWELGQGFLYSRPVPFADAREMARARRLL